MPRRRIGSVRGLFTALLTPFDKTGFVDREALASLVRFQISKGVDGLYPCGSTGLGPMLSLDERKEVARIVVDEAKGKVPVIVQVGRADTASTVLLAKHAERVGADAVASLTPFYYKPGEVAIVKHFETVAGSVSVPLLAYNIPQFTGNNLQPKTVASLARKSTIAGVKDSARDVLQFLDLLEEVPDGFVVMNGTEEYALYSMMMGGDGIVSGGANALPELFRAMVDAVWSGDFLKAAAHQKKILGFKDAVRDAPMASYYAILKARGVDVGVPRLPFLPLAGPEERRLLASLKTQDFPTSEKE